MRHLLSRAVAGFALAVLTFAVSAADEAANPIGRFEITRFEVEGNTLLPAQTVATLLAPFAGTSRDFGDVQRALEALEAAYQKHGFNVVQITLPEQELNQGVVHLKVIEARIGKVSVEGNQVFDQANIRHSLPGLREGETPNIRKISSSLKMANENPAKKTTLQLQSGDRDDEINALLQVEDGKAWKIGANLDNTGNSGTGKSHLGLVYQHANIAGLDHVLSLQYTTTLEKPSQVSVYGVGYHIPLYAIGDSVDLFGSYSNVDSGSVSAGLLDLKVSGKGAVYGVRYNHNFGRSGDFDSKLIAGFDYKAFKNSVELLGAQLGNDVTVHPLSVTYAGTWTLSGGEAGFYLTGLHNVPGGDHGTAADFDRVRAGASTKYSILRYGANASRSFSNNWQVRANFSGQYTRDSLIPGEQFGAGGSGSVRGFTEREIANDSGRLASAELYTPNLCSGVERIAIQCRMLAFYDSAYATRNHRLPGEQGVTSIGSAGLGLRMAIDRFFTLQMDYGSVVDAGGTQGKGDTRLHFLLGVSY